MDKSDQANKTVLAWSVKYWKIYFLISLLSGTIVLPPPYSTVSKTSEQTKYSPVPSENVDTKYSDQMKSCPFLDNDCR